MVPCLVGAVLVAHGQNAITRATYVKNAVPEMTGKNGYEEYVVGTLSLYATQQSRDIQSAQDSRGKEGYLAGLAKVVEENGDLYRMIVAGNAKPVVYPRLKTMTSDTIIAELAEFKKAGYFLSEKAEYEFAVGQPDTGYQTFIEGLIFARKVQTSGAVIRFIGGSAMFNNMIRSANFEVPPSLSSCKKIEKACDVYLKPSDCAGVMLDEIDMFARMRARGSDTDIEGLIYTFMNGDDSTEAVNAIRSVTDKVLERLDGFVESMRRYESGDERDLLDGMKALQPTANSDSQVDAAVMQEERLGVAVMELEAVDRTWLRLLRLKAMVWEYRWEKGVFPGSLNDLGAGDKETDSFTGKPYRYEVVDGRPDVWSDGYLGSGEIRLGTKAKFPQFPGNGVEPPSRFTPNP